MNSFEVRMQVILAGLNLDIETIKELKSFIRLVMNSLKDRTFKRMDPQSKENIINNIYDEAVSLYQSENLTPETLSAAYARISRNPKPVNELREIARKEVDRARKSNQNIIFGLGHSSVAEHATFNFDIIGASRYAVETIEHFRLASYTEKSQRYILFEDDFVIPKEITNASLKRDFVALIREQNEVYNQLYKTLRPYIFDLYKELAKDSKNHRLLEGLAKEDARYVISLATQTQLGMTINARTLENMIAKCNAHPLSEIREYGSQLYNITKDYTPSIVKYVEPTKYLQDKNSEIQNFVYQINSIYQNKICNSKIDVQLIDFHPANSDDLLLAKLIFHYTNLDFSEAVDKIKTLNKEGKKKFFREIFKNINAWDSVLREFEFVYFTFQLIVSASNYGQLKRHRMANIISQDYDINLGVTIPESVEKTNQKKLFLEICEKTNSLFNKLSDLNPRVAPYILTNSHRRRVLFKINLRELYHFSRLREDQHAQWDIRQVAEKIVKKVQKLSPLSAVLLSGKDKFEQRYQDFFRN
jgi:flavin-dependent thymidylate synthase